MEPMIEPILDEQGGIAARKDRPPVCQVYDLGLISYSRGVDLQKRLVLLRKQREIPDCLLLLEHNPVITLGRTGRREHLLADARRLEELGVEFHSCERGGDITFHGPGQLVLYPILDLQEWHKDIHLFLRTLEECLLQLLHQQGIGGERLPGSTGVWVNHKKIAAIGVRTSQWVTSHGLAFNVNNDLDFFKLIIPCGIADKGVTSLAMETGQEQSMALIKPKVGHHFGSCFGREMVWHDRLPSLLEIER
jgi:lipoyl(octanoyl) transferase